jgi:transcriptional regulator with XRE-family HTH domain
MQRGALVKFWAKRRGLVLTQVAAALGLSKGYLWDAVLTGRYPQPDERWRLIAGLLGMPLEWLADEDTARVVLDFLQRRDPATITAGGLAPL